MTCDANRTALKRTIVKYLEEKGFKTVKTVEETKNNTSQVAPRGIENAIQGVLRQRIKKMGDVIFQVDLEAAVRYSLRQEVSAVQTIKGNQLEALAAYLQVLKKYFPFYYNSSSFIDELLTLTSNSGAITGLQIEEIVKRAESNGTFSSKLKFLGCEGSSIRYRRYPCSLWRLFHYLTVNSALLNINNKWTNHREVLDAMHGYVKYFFGCAHCSRHFQQMAAERNITEVLSLESSILWLWESHNVVNARLKGDPTEDAEYPKKQFPDRIRCPECVDDDGSWKKEEVLKYLKRMYSNANVRYIGADTYVFFRDLD
jgi:thiol oxidase